MYVCGCFSVSIASSVAVMCDRKADASSDKLAGSREVE